MRLALTIVVFVAAAAVAPGMARAQVRGETTWIGGSFGLSPVGTLKAKATLGGNTLDTSTDAATAFQINGLLDFHLSPLFSIGFAPGIIFNVKGTGDTDSGSELDLPIRLALGGPVAPTVRLYGFVSPGYTVLFPPSDDQNATGHPSGFMIGFGGGASFRVAPGIRLTGELGYQFRFVSTTVQGADLSLQVNYLTLAFGIVAAIH
jgi:hypothetical protein